MPVLDNCVNGLFTPGNIGSSSGETPTVITPGSLLDPNNYDPAIITYSLHFARFYNVMYHNHGYH